MKNIAKHIKRGFSRHIRGVIAIVILALLAIFCFAFAGCNSNKETLIATSPISSEKKTYYRIMTEESDTVYLRQKSYGDYTGKGFMEAEKYSSASQTVGGLSYSAKALESTGYKKQGFILTRYQNSEKLYLPYYFDTFNFSDDVSASVNSDSVTGFYYYYDYLQDQSVKLESEYLTEQNDYYQFVREEYLKIDQTLKEKIKNAVMLDESSPTFVNDVVEYLENLAIYNLNFNAYPKNCDVVEYFLTKSKEGTCQHFASSAVMIYRAYGIPARFCIGYKVKTQGGLYVDVTSDNGHAWAEIYVKDFGWVKIEVTPSAPSVPITPQNPLKKITISTPTASKIYDGKPLSDGRVDIVTGQLKDGHSIQILSFPSVITVETVLNQVRFKVVDGAGNDVGNEYDIDCVYGKLIVGYRTLYVKTADVTEKYIGSPITNGNREVKVSGLVEGHEFSCEFDARLDDAGICDNTITNPKVKDNAGSDLGYNYHIIVEFGKLTATRDNYSNGQKLNVYIYTVSKVYDGESVQINSNYYYNIGALTDGDSIECLYDYQVKDELGNIVDNDKIINAGEYTVTAKCKIVNDGELVQNKYDITVCGKIVIRRRLITLSSETIIKEFDGKQISSSGWALTYGTPAKNQAIVVKVVGIGFAQGHSPSVIEYIEIDGQRMTAIDLITYQSLNYIVRAIEGTIIIK